MRISFAVIKLETEPESLGHKMVHGHNVNHRTSDCTLFNERMWVSVVVGYRHKMCTVSYGPILAICGSMISGRRQLRGLCITASGLGYEISLQSLNL